MTIPSDRVELKLDLLGLHTERVWVRRTLSQAALISKIVAQFGEAFLLEPAEQYALFRSGDTQPNAVPLSQVRTTLQFRVRSALPAGTQRPIRRLVLLDQFGGRFPVSWVPGVIGRENNDSERPQVVALSKHGRYPKLTDETSRSYLIIEQISDGTLTVRVDGDPTAKPALLRKKLWAKDQPTPNTVPPAQPAATPMGATAYRLDDGDELVLVNGDVTLTVRIIEPI